MTQLKVREAEHVRQVLGTWYRVAILLGTNVFISILAMVIALQVSTRQERQREADRIQAQAQALRVVCDWIGANIDAFDELPPPTPAARAKLRVKYIELYNLYRCTPARK